MVCPRVTDAALVVGRRRGGTAGRATTGTAWPAPWWPATCSSAARRRPAATTRSSARCPASNIRASRSPRSTPTARWWSRSTRAPAALVSVGTVTAQLLYEIAGPAYANPDVVARFDTIRLDEEAPDRVRVSGVRGEPAPATPRSRINHLGGYRNTVTFVLTGLDVEAKAELVTTLPVRLPRRCASVREVDVDLARPNSPMPTATKASARLRVTVKDADARQGRPRVLGRRGRDGAGQLPRLPPHRAARRRVALGVYWPALVPAALIEQVVVLDDGGASTSRPAAHVPVTHPVDQSEPCRARTQLRRRGRPDVPLGDVFGARSGDKGGNANVGVWARSDAGVRVAGGRADGRAPARAGARDGVLAVDRYALPNLRALNFVVVGLLGEGRRRVHPLDAQAKALGELLRQRAVAVPEDPALTADWCDPCHTQ